MTAIVAPVRHAMAQAAAWLLDQGDTVPHVYGLAAREALGAAPRYVWVPTRTRDRGDTPTQPIDRTRELFSQREHLEIDCWGRTDAEAWAMRCNVCNALDVAYQADLQFEDGQWVRPGGAHNQSGELYRLEMSITVPIVEGYIALADLLVPQPDTFIVEGVEARIFKSPATDVDGEEFGTVAT